MTTFNYTVDTVPMANEITRVSRSVNRTTGAVVAMQTAVVVSGEKAANRVCNNLNTGFYSLIRSQISQKMAKLQSDVDSLMMELVQQKNALLANKKRMERDYNMITSRYVKLFNGLNANLRQRVFELDKPTTDFAVKEVDKLWNRTKYLTATIPVSQLESVSYSQRILSSNAKKRGLNVINSMKSYLLELNSQKRLTEKILINADEFRNSSKLYMPLIVLKYNKEKDNHTVDMAFPDQKMNNAAKSTLKNTVYDTLSQHEWIQDFVPDEEITSEFSRLVSASSRSQRIKDLTMHLFRSSSMPTTKQDT